MKSGRSGVVSLIQANATSLGSLTTGLIDGMREALSQNALQFHLERIPIEAMADESLWPRALREWTADGIIINYVRIDVPDIEELLHRYSVPAIWTNAQRRADCIFPDDLSAFVTVTEDLLRLGHQRIFYMAGGDPLHYSTRDRQAGYEKAMAGAGLSPEIGRLVDEKRRERYEFIRSVVTRPVTQRPTAVLCYSDADAVDFWWAAQASGMQVPGDLSVVTVENSEIYHEGRQLSAMRLPWTDVGAGAVRLLLQKIENPHIKLPPQTVPLGAIVGDTHAAPGSSC
jgi:DNA-binding LacI/PurR family transcriptional regulator